MRTRSDMAAPAARMRRLTIAGIALVFAALLAQSSAPVVHVLALPHAYVAAEMPSVVAGIGWAPVATPERFPHDDASCVLCRTFIGNPGYPIARSLIVAAPVSDLAAPIAVRSVAHRSAPDPRVAGPRAPPVASV